MYLRLLLKTIALPPGPGLILIAFGLFLLKRSPRIAKLCLFGGFIFLWVCSLPLVASLLSSWNQQIPALTIEQAITQAQNNPNQAIVILGGGRNHEAPEYAGEDTVNKGTLLRLRYGAYLAQSTQLPILVTGGLWGTDTISEAELMRNALEQSFGLSPKWLETKSRTTWENAQFTQEILSKENITDIILVTEASHIKRATEVFEYFGFTVLPAATGYKTHKFDKLLRLIDWIPSAVAFYEVYVNLHELYGRAWYRLQQ